MKDIREIVDQPVNESFRLIPLTQGKCAIVDAEDYPQLSKFNWHAWRNPRTGQFYALRSERVNGKQKAIWMSREIMQAPEDKVVDHKEPSLTLDNRKSNLRIANLQQNNANSRDRFNKSGFRGVYKKRNCDRWISQVSYKGRTVYIGCFPTPEAAHEAYRSRAKYLFGEFSRA